MELYILDSSLRRTAVIDVFESLIWTERYSAYGDFQLVMHSTLATRSLLTLDTRLAINVSYRVMVVESIENKTDSDGKTNIIVTGRSLEAILMDRIVKHTLSNLTVEPKWVLTGTPGSILRQIFTAICVTGALNAGDIIPFITSGSIFPANNIPEPADSVSIEVVPDTLYNVIKTICDIYELGFRLYRNLDTSQLHFDIYSGNDRTTSQNILPAVVFSSELDNLANTSEFTSSMQFKNIAYVFAPSGFTIVYGDGATSSTSGFARRILLVMADDIKETNPVLLEALLQQRGLDELSKNRSVLAFDGEIPQSGKYKYEFAYQLGDLVEMRNLDGVTNNMRVTEQIFVDDAQGERSYPTLALNLIITPGSWLAWDNNQEWDSAVGTWDAA